MAVQLPSEKEIRTALARLITRGVDSVWLPEVQPLFRLPAVQAKLTEVGEDQAPEALQAVLREAIEALGQSQYRTLLTIVLGLEPEYATLSAGEKRRLAGRKFRGGQSMVSAGTIRQHHEPRALDELAAMLLSPSAEKRAGKTLGPVEGQVQAGPARIEWHPAARQAWTHEELSFWRVSLADYSGADAIREVDELMRRTGVTSWAVYELLGVFDLLIRAWLPAETSSMEFERAAAEVFGGNLLLIDQFGVNEVVTHWPWQEQAGTAMRLPEPTALSHGVPAREIEQLNSGEEAILPMLRDRNIATLASESAGIGFVIAVTARQNPLASSRSRDMLKEQLVRVLDAATAIRERSLYRGSGFAHYLIQGRVGYEEFHELRRSLVEPINADLGFIGIQTHTFVIATPSAVARHEALGVDLPGEKEPTARELLDREETATFEVKGSAFTDLVREPPTRDSRVTQGLMRAVTALLNGKGGNVIIGALDKKHASRHPLYADRPELAGPEVGRYLVPGIERELEDDPDRFERRLRDAVAKFVEPDPNALIESRIEDVEGKPVCVLTIPDPDRASLGSWFYLKGGPSGYQFVVRRGAADMALAGVEADNYKRLNSR